MAAPDADERRPLLAAQQGNGELAPDHGAIERQNGSAEPSGQPDANTPVAEEPDVKKLLIIMCSMWVGVVMNALGIASNYLAAGIITDLAHTDTTVVATLSGAISTSFNSFHLVSWLATAYLISNAAIQPLTGRLTDIFSRRAGFIASAIFFAGGNLICGLAKSEGVIIAGRVIAGMGGGGINTISTFVGSDLVPLRNRGVWQGFGNLFYGLGSGLGGVFGGYLNDTIGWRWAFLIQVPVILVSAVLVFFTVHIPVKETDKSRIKRVDFLGAFTMVVSIVLLLLALNSGGNVVPWNHPLVYVPLPLSFVFLLLFIYVEDRVAAEPIIPVRLMLNRTVWSANLTNSFASMSAYSLMFYGPVYFQIIGMSTSAAGVRFVPFAIGASFGSLSTGWVMRKTGRYWWLNVFVQACVVVSCIFIAVTMDGRVTSWPTYIYFFLNGTGYGGMLTVTLLALISAVDHEHQAVITSSSYLFRSAGSTVGITIVSTVFQNISKAQLWARFGDWPNAEKIIPRIRDSINEVKHLPPEWKNGVIEVYMQALRGVWITILGMAVLAAVTSLFMREHVLHRNLARK